ncbi:hypothetical protein BgiMline_031591 [Biomphalaria glabrata]
MGLFQTKFDYGTHETAVLNTDDVDGEVKLAHNCHKDHTKYVLANDLRLENLPEVYREPDLFDLIQCIAELTVRITVKFCSAKRRKFWMGTEAEYPGYKDRGNESRLIGSGRICDVVKVENDEMKCPCKDCKGANSEKRDVWNIHVFTATHVVYDSEEAVKSEVKIFYKKSDKKEQMFHGVKTIWSNALGDLCVLSCVTCDKTLATQLLQTIKQFNILWSRIRVNYKNDKKLEYRQRKYKDRIVVIVSHPHGGDKSVSFDKLETRVGKRIYLDRGWHLNYKASTCTGSSGAPVYLYGMDCFTTEYVHSGSNGDYNYSTTWCPK